MEAWQQALETVQGKSKAEIAAQLLWLAEHKPIAFRRLLSLVFEPNTLQVRTERVEGTKKWRGVVVGYQLTEKISELQKEAVSFGNFTGVRLQYFHQP